MFFKSLKHKLRDNFENETEVTASYKQISNTNVSPSENNMQPDTSLQKMINEEKIPASISQNPDTNVVLAKPRYIETDTQNICDDGLDVYFNEAAEIITSKEKASIGMIQRYLKIGFNRAAKIMDQLEEAGIVGPEEGTRPRKVLITNEEFLQREDKIIVAPQGKSSQPEPSFAPNSRFEEEAINQKFGLNANFDRDGENISNLINSFIYNCSDLEQHKIIEKLLTTDSSKTLTFVIYDEDGMLYERYNGLPQLLVPIVTNSFKLTNIIDWLATELKSRLQEFSSTNIKNFETYNVKCESPIPAIVFVVSEFYFSKSYFDNDVLLRIALNGNRAGIYLLFFSQFDSKKIHFGMLEDLLTIQTPEQAYSLFFPNAENVYSASESMHPRSFDNMTGKEFENFCCSILNKNGFYNTETTKDSGDHGIDILTEKDDITYAIQCKCYSSNIGNAAVQQAHTGKSLYHKDIAVVLTNQYFTQQAQAEAKALGVKLWDRDKLQNMINHI